MVIPAIFRRWELSARATKEFFDEEVAEVADVALATANMCPKMDDEKGTLFDPEESPTLFVFNPARRLSTALDFVAAGEESSFLIMEVDESDSAEAEYADAKITTKVTKKNIKFILMERSQNRIFG